MKSIDHLEVAAAVNKLSSEDHHGYRYLFHRNAALTESIQDRAWETQLTLQGCYAAIRGRIR
jgi:hypothetical protein